jgi:hypothetical protein
MKARDRDHYSDRIAAPVGGATVVVDNGVMQLRAAVDEFGRAVLDGLAPGDYTLSVFATGYPEVKRRLGPPRMVSTDRRGCGVEVVAVSER